MKTSHHNNITEFDTSLNGAGCTSAQKDHCLKRQSGFSLIEVMISAFILSVSILGLLSMQLTGMKGTQESYMKQQAMGVVQNLTERMRANKSAVIARNYLVDSSFNCGMALPNCSTSSCSPDQIAKTDILNVLCGSQTGGGNATGGINGTLSKGSLNVTCATQDIAAGIAANCASGDVVIRVGWQERAVNQNQVVEPDSLEVQTRIGQ